MANLACLLMPVHQSYDWQYDGACTDADPERFFSPEFERGARRERRESQAKSWCARCPVVQQCLEHALQVQEPFGTWGGLPTQEREALLAQRLHDIG